MYFGLFVEYMNFLRNCIQSLTHHMFWLKMIFPLFPVQGNHSVQGSPGQTTSPSELTQLTLESTLGKAARRTSEEYLESAYTEADASESQNSLAKQIDKNNFQTSLVPTPCLSPPGRRSESSQQTPDPIIKAKDLPAHQVPASVVKSSLKEISGETLKPMPAVSVSGFPLVYICGQQILLCAVLSRFAHISSSIYFSSFG